MATVFGEKRQSARTQGIGPTLELSISVSCALRPLRLGDGATSRFSTIAGRCTFSPSTPVAHLTIDGAELNVAVLATTQKH